MSENLTTLQKLRLKAAGGVPPAAPAAAPVAPAAAPAAPAAAPTTAADPGLASLLSSPATPPAPAAAAPAAAAPVAPAAAAPAQEPATLAPVERAPTPPMETALSNEVAEQMLLGILGHTTSYGDVLTAGIESSEDGPMIAMKQPFAAIKLGNWDVMKDKYPAEVYDGMPTGDRPYTAIYLGHRIGGVGWQGAPGTVGNKPPAFKFVVPTMRRNPADPKTFVLNELMLDFTKATLRVSSKIMFTKAKERAKFDLVGRLTPEIHLHVWRPDTGFILLVCKGFKGVNATNEKMHQTKMIVGAPYSFTIETHSEHNPKGTVEDKNQDWKSYSVTATPIDQTSPLAPKATEYHGKLVELSRRDPVAVVTAINSFNDGSDFEGLDDARLTEVMDSYTDILGKSVFQD